MKKSIKGGILFDRTDNGSFLAPEKYPLPEKIKIVSKHPLISDGDAVFAGSAVADGEKIPMLSPISGKASVKKGDDFENSGEYIICVESDGKSTPAPDCVAYDKLTGKSASEITADEFIGRIRRLAVPDGDDGALADRLSRALGKSYMLAIMAFDCRPYTDLRRRAAAVYPDKIIGAAKLIMSAMGIKDCKIILPSDDRDLCGMIDAKLAPDRNFIGTTEICPIYPSDNGKLIFNLIIGRELGAAKLPEEHGLLIIPADIAAAVYDGFVYGAPYIRSLVYVGGPLAEDGGCLSVPLYTKISDLTDICSANGGITVENGLMNGRKCHSDDCTDSFTRTLTVTKPLRRQTADCIGCGECDDVCPMYLLVRKTAELKSGGLRAKFDRLLFSDYLARTEGICIGCGCCSYVCPSNIKLGGLSASGREYGNDKGGGDDE